MKLTVIRIALAIFALACLPAAEAALSPAHLRCEYSVDPLGIDVPNPRLFWTVESKERGEQQSAYQILAASTADQLTRDNGDLWDSGKITSSETTHIGYGGRPLRSSQQVFWKIRVWDRTGIVSAWSPTGTWTMGVVGTNDWQAKWICAPAATETLLLRKEFIVKPGLKRAVVHVCGLGQYELQFNGAKAGDDLLSPGWTDYNDTTLYDTKDVTALLHEGSNAVSLTLGNGMYNVVRRNRFVKFTGSFGALRAISQLRLEYADGSTETVGTDETWRTAAGPTIFSNIYGGEDYDGRLEPRGWDRTGFDDSTWRPAVVLVRPPGKLRGHSVSSDPLRAIEIHKPIATQPLNNGDVVYDLGQNAGHMPRLTVTGPAGSTIRLIPSEIVSDDGTVNQSTMGAGRRGSSWWEYTKGTDGEETWMPKFCYIGCRYLQVRVIAPVGQAFQSAGSGDFPVASSNTAGNTALESAVNRQAGKPALPPRIVSVEGVVVHSSAAPVGDFSCSNDLLNRTRTLVRWAQRANMVSVLTDCPHREKLGWLEQYHLNGPAIRYEFDMARMFTKGMNDMADAQLKNGLVPNIAPEYTVFDGTFRAATEWGSAFVIVPWQQYQFDADLDLLRQHYDAMKHYFGYLESIAVDDIVSEGLGDWYDLVPGQRPGVARLTLPPVTATAFYYHDATLIAKVAELLGKSADAKDYAARADRIRGSFNRHFFHADKNTYASGSQCANAMALVFGIVDAQYRDAVLASLVQDVGSRGYAMTAGDVGFRFLLQALAQSGRSETIYKMINQDDKPGYGYQLKKGATSLTEAWDANNSSSHNHFMLGHITEWFYKDLAGIEADPSGAGFKKILIHPAPVGDLTWVKASYDSIHGRIASEWNRDGGKLILKVTIPANTTATVFVPAKSADEVKESGKAAKQSDGVKFLRSEKDRAVFAVQSGDYTFESRF
jgi:alpha-L-rhamnosidase